MLAGLGLKTGDFNSSNGNKNQLKQVIQFNTFVQGYNFGIVSSITYCTSKILLTANSINHVLSTGIILCSCLPMTIASVTVFTKSSNGNEAFAILNSAIANVIAIIATPSLIILYTNVGDSDDKASGDMDVNTTNQSTNNNVFLSLLLRVALPILVGQLLQRSKAHRLLNYIEHHKGHFRKAQLYAIIYIVYTVFATTFYHASTADSTSSRSSGTSDIRISQIAMLIMVQLFLLLLVTALAWLNLGCFFPNEPKLRVMGLFGCTQKSVRNLLVSFITESIKILELTHKLAFSLSLSPRPYLWHKHTNFSSLSRRLSPQNNLKVAMGVPLIGAIYENDPNVGLYTLPLLIWYPLQLIIGSLLIPQFRIFVANECQRLNLVETDDGDDEVIYEEPSIEKEGKLPYSDKEPEPATAIQTCQADDLSCESSRTTCLGKSRSLPTDERSFATAHSQQPKPETGSSRPFYEENVSESYDGSNYDSFDIEPLHHHRQAFRATRAGELSRRLPHYYSEPRYTVPTSRMTTASSDDDIATAVSAAWTEAWSVSYM